MNVGGERVYTYSITSAIDRPRKVQTYLLLLSLYNLNNSKILLENMDND